MIQKIKNILGSIANKIDNNLMKTELAKEKYHIAYPVMLCILSYGLFIVSTLLAVEVLMMEKGDPLELAVIIHSTILGAICLFAMFKSSFSVGVHVHRYQAKKEEQALQLAKKEQAEREKIAFVITDIEGGKYRR